MTNGPFLFLHVKTLHPTPTRPSFSKVKSLDWRTSAKKIDTNKSTSLRVVDTNAQTGILLKREVPYAFRDLMIHGDLQFTLRIAFRCALHHCGCQGIRGLQLFLGFCFFTFRETFVSIKTFPAPIECTPSLKRQERILLSQSRIVVCGFLL